MFAMNPCWRTPMQNRRTRITAGLASLLALAALALTAPTAAEAATGAPPGLYKLPGSVSLAELSAGLTQEQAEDLTTPIEPSSPHCETLTDGNRLCSQLSAEPAAASSMALTSPDDDDTDPGTAEDPASSCSITPAWTYSRFSYCYMSSVTSTLTHPDTGVVDVAHSIISGEGKLNRNTGEWTENNLVTFVDATGLLTNSIVTFSAVCSGACTTTQSAAWSVTGVPMVPGESLTETITFRDTPAPGAVDRLTNAYQFGVAPSSGNSIGVPASWSNPHAVRCDKTMVSNTATGCVIGDWKPILEISATDSRYGAAAATYYWAQRALIDRWGSSGAPLTRFDDAARKTRNRRQTCQDLSSEPFINEPTIVPTDSCDEYPFAGTEQGGKDGALCAEIVPLLQNGVWQFYAFNSRPNTGNEPCVRSHVPLLQNTTAGSAYSGFIGSQHVIDQENFYIDAKIT
ncbi:NucA/NucB deoxyribonuclease domain-containing protein [Streptomyces hokutonensis]|uniref:NucA/NucB deoxyribonuclease domain-containing protein n=1 Tax=Streptomyces hokutonensis TaxID=1306990 RepID=UPI003F53FD52